MHVDISPRRFELQPGIPQAISVTISNTGSVIGGYAVRILGADPSWVEVEDGEISLFPEESRTLVVMVTVPAGMTAGERRLAVQVRELTPPEESTVEDVVFTVPEAAAVTLRVDPLAVTAGRTARLNLLLDNTGNTPVHQRLHGQDPEGRVRFRFDPEVVRLAPGEHTLVDLRATARQPLTGSPVVRPLELRLVDPDTTPLAPEPAAEDGADSSALKAPSLGRRKTPRVADDVPVLGNATFVQKALVSRGPISLLGLLAAVTIFAIVITLSLSQIVGQSAADRDLALEIAAAREGGSGSGTAGMAGTVKLLTSGAPVPGVAVNVFAADDTEVPLATTATGDQGTWTVGQLPAGDYKVTFRGAGFVQLWFPQAVDAADGETVTLEAGKQQAGLDVALGGVPASIAGTVSGVDVSAATLTLKAPLSGIPVDPATTAAEQGATVTSVPVGDDGTFELENVPSPSVYDLVVEKQGYATSTQRIDVSAGEERKGVEITLRQGDGVISGVVSSAAGPLGGATIVATSGQTSVTTMSLTEGEVGGFTLRGLPTPASFTVVVTMPDHASQTLSLTLAEGQRLTGVGVTLNKSSGRLTGHVTTQADEQPAPGVLVSVTDGVQTFQTATSSEESALGEWRVSGLALPGDYTITFSRADLEPQTLLVSLDGQGNLVAGAQGATVTAGDITAAMRSATAVIEGVVEQRQLQGRPRSVGEATVSLSSNTSTYTVTTASVPSAFAGHYRLEGVPPGTYTLSVGRNGVRPVSSIVNLAAGDDLFFETLLDIAASVSGRVTVDGEPVPAGWVVELYRASEYPDPVYQSVRTDDQGRFVFRDVDAPGAYIVQARRTRGTPASGSRTVQVDTSEAAIADVKVERRG